MTNDKTHLQKQVTIVDSTKDGPLISVTAGLHGDEISGVQSVILASKQIRPKIGKIRYVPILNEKAYSQQTRFYQDNSEDIDLNHIMPGNDTSNAAQLAKHIFELIRNSDYHIDIHSARVGQINYPHVRADLSHEKTKKLALAQPFAVLDWPATKTTLRGCLNKEDVGAITIEAGEGLQVHYQDELHKLITSAIALEPLNEKPDIYTNHKWIRATENDTCIVAPGEQVVQGQIISEKGITSPFDGLIIGTYLNPVAKSRLVHIAYDMVKVK